MTDQLNDTIVVGAGLAGLAAAATAATHGSRVSVLEARSHEGGRARTTEVDGFLLNQGAHALYRGGAAWDVLTGFGIAPQGHAPDAGRAVGLRADGTLDALPGTTAGLLRTRIVGPRGKLQLARLLGHPARLTNTVEPGMSLQDWIDARSRDAGVRALLAMLGRVATYCGDAAGIDAAAGVAQIVQAMTHGVVYLDGGWQQLVDALREAAVERGVTIHTGAKAHAVEARADGVTVRTSSGDFDARAVVLAAGGPTDAAALLHGASAALTQWARDEQPVFASALDVAMRALPVPDRRITFGLDEPVYLSVHTPYARLAADDGEVAHLLWYGDPTTDPRARLEALLDVAQPGWRDEVVTERYGHRLVVAHGRPRPGLGIAGRPPVTVPDVPGVFVAGDWVGRRGVLTDAVLGSAEDAARAAVAHIAATTKAVTRA